MSAKQLTVHIQEETYKVVQWMAESRNKSVHATMVEMIEQYVDAWQQNKSLTAQNKDVETTGFILLQLLRSLSENNDEYRTFVRYAINARNRSESLDDYIDKLNSE